MIRFIDIGKQYWGYTPSLDDDDDYREEFAFIDTAVDRFVDVNGFQCWDCWDDFEEDYIAFGGWRGALEPERFKSLTNEKFFRQSSVD